MGAGMVGKATHLPSPRIFRKIKMKEDTKYKLKILKFSHHLGTRRR
jgi:hypothetical protein